MANELSVYYPVPSLSSIYFVVEESQDQAWNGSAFETLSTSKWITYVIPGTDTTATGTYLASFPTGIAVGTTVFLYAYRRVGSTAAPSDTLIGTQLNVTWNGTTLATGGGGPGYGLTGSGTTLAQATDSTLCGTTDRLIAANSFSATTQAYLRMPRQGQAQAFWDGFEQLVTSYFGGVPISQGEASTRLAEYASALNAQAQVADEIMALVAANAGSLHTTINPVGTSSETYRTFP